MNLQRANLKGVDLRRAYLNKASLIDADLSRAALRGASLFDANLAHADFTEANLNWANLSGASLFTTNFKGAKLYRANLFRANLWETNFAGANLRNANLCAATLLETCLEGANLTGCWVWGVSAWNVKLKGAIQSNLLINPTDESPIQVDNLEMAQFIYLLLNNEKIRSVIDTLTSKVVLILGRFTPERMAVLDAIREDLRKRNYLPVLFYFQKPATKDLTGTITTLANMARFVIADLTEPNSVPHELATIIPNVVVPVQAIILKGQRAYPMFADLKRRHNWVLRPYQYRSKELLIAQLGKSVIAPAEAKAKKLAPKKREIRL